MDEPGLTLHARAQGDLLRYINEQLKPEYQVVYTAHSPFMIDTDNILSARTVEDVVITDSKTKEEQLLGTKVSSKILSKDPDTISPLQNKL
ncbi:ATP-binding protein [Leptospira stimsonii]|uniref:ATP-binding protein n=1 Tax=Leptospira stimsonii TaxID=2202203 RepID=UPI001F512A1B|nr:ATP-binding protein [Leptospira stimsonii]